MLLLIGLSIVTFIWTISFVGLITDTQATAFDETHTVHFVDWLAGTDQNSDQLGGVERRTATNGNNKGEFSTTTLQPYRPMISQSN